MIIKVPVFCKNRISQLQCMFDFEILAILCANMRHRGAQSNQKNNNDNNNQSEVFLLLLTFEIILWFNQF